MVPWEFVVDRNLSNRNFIETAISISNAKTRNLAIDDGRMRVSGGFEPLDVFLD